MSDDKLGVEKLFANVKFGMFGENRYRLKHYSFMIPTLAPGEKYQQSFLIERAFRPKRIIANVKAFAPDFKYYQRGVGGSKRRGRLASLRFHAELLRHPYLSPHLTIDNVHIGINAQMVGGGVPIQVFEPNAFIGDVMMDVAEPGKTMTFSFTNREFSRSVAGNLACLGDGL